MPEQTLVVFALVAGLILFGAAIAARNRRRRLQLQHSFGAEYERMVKSLGSRARAADELTRRRNRVAGFDIRPLTDRDRARFAAEWGQIQSRFVDRPQQAVANADRLVSDVMAARGYRVEDVPQRRADLSAALPGVVEDYRQARAIAERTGKGGASTEDLRQAVMHYRELFSALLKPEASAVAPVGPRRALRPGLS